MGSRFDDIRILPSSPTSIGKYTLRFCIYMLLSRPFRNSSQMKVLPSNRIYLILTLKDYLKCSNLHYYLHFPRLKNWKYQRIKYNGYDQKSKDTTPSSVDLNIQTKIK